MFNLPTIPTIPSVTKLAQTAAAAVNLPIPTALAGGVPVPAGTTTEAPPAETVQKSLALGSTRPSTNSSTSLSSHWFRFPLS